MGRDGDWIRVNVNPNAPVFRANTYLCFVLIFVTRHKGPKVDVYRPKKGQHLSQQRRAQAICALRVACRRHRQRWKLTSILLRTVWPPCPTMGFAETFLFFA